MNHPDEIAVTLAAGTIIDMMTGGKLDWRARVGESDFLESADWLTAMAYARAALNARDRRTDRFTLVLTMIREGCADPAEFARRVLSEFGD